MKIQIIRTSEADGEWYKVKIDDSTQACISITEGKDAEALQRAEKIYDFCKENRGKFKVIKEEEIN